MRFHRDKSHQRRKYRAPNDGHHEQRSSQLGVWPQALQSQSKDRWEHQGHEKAGQKHAPKSEPTRMRDGNSHQHDVRNTICTHEPARTDEAHQPGGGKAAYAKSGQRTNQQITGDLFGLMRILLNIGNEVTPGTSLCADVEKLCDNREQKMRITEEVMKVSTVAGLTLVFTLNRRKVCPQNEHRPEDGNRPDNQIRLYHSQRFGTKIRLVSMMNLSNCDFLRR